MRGRLIPGQRFPTGMRPGRRRAYGMDLDSISPYAPGDDVRWMDWRATARTGRAQMKRFVAESHLARMLIVDFRAHLLFGTGSQPMLKTAALLAAQLAWEALLLQEPVGLVMVPDLVRVRPRRGRNHILFLLQHIADGYQIALSRGENQPHAATDMDHALIAAVDIASDMLGSGDEICVFSDFGDDSPGLSAKVRALNTIRRFRAIIVEDPMLHRELPVPAGRYPYQAVREPHRNVATVPKSDMDRQQDLVGRLRGDLRRRLIRAGWNITETGKQGYLPPGAAR
jgi:uncharacterized protein (DUF58 family)